MFKIYFKNLNDSGKTPVKHNYEFRTIDAAWDYIYGTMTRELGLREVDYDKFIVDFSDEGPIPSPDPLTVYKEGVEL